MGGESSVFDEPFTWQPPSKAFPISSFGKRLGAEVRSYWTKIGPDAIEVGTHHALKVVSGQDGVFRHITLLDEDGDVLVDMSGEVVANATLEEARTFDVRVKNPDSLSFGIFDWHKTLVAMLLATICHTARFTISIYFEKNAVAGTIPFWRNVNAALFWICCCIPCCVDIWPGAMTGERPQQLDHDLGHLIILIVVCGVAFLSVSEYSLGYVMAPVVFFLCGPRLYLSTKKQYPERQLKASVLWAVANYAGTSGASIVMTLVGVAYAVLLQQRQTVSAAFFLPLGTALAELGMVIYTRIMYHKLVWSKRSDGVQRVAGDQLYLTASAMIVCAHGFAEATRFAATFCGAVLSGGYNWLPTTFLGMALNLSARLGWSRFALIQITKKYCGGPTAMAYWAPSGWSKYHDEARACGGGR